MKAVVAAFNQEKALVGAFSVITTLRMQFGCNFLRHYLEHRLQVRARGLLPLLHLDGLLVLGGARVLAHRVLLAQHFLQHGAAVTGGCWGTGLRRGGGCVIAELASWCDISVL